MKTKIKQYFADFIIIIGISILSFNVLRPPVEKGGFKLPSIGYTDYHTGWKVFGIFLIAVGIDMVIRKYLSSKINH